MEKIVRLIASPFQPPIETAFNLTLSLSAPYSEREVTIIFDGNTTEYQESIKNESIEIKQFIITESTQDSIQHTFNLDDQSNFGLRFEKEYYEIRLKCIGKENIEGQDFFYFEFIVNNLSNENLILNIENEGTAIVWFDPKKNLATFTPKIQILWGRFEIEGNTVFVLSKGNEFGAILIPKFGRMVTLYETEVEKDFETRHMIAITWCPTELKVYHNDMLKTSLDPKNLV